MNASTSSIPLNSSSSTSASDFPRQAVGKEMGEAFIIPVLREEAQVHRVLEHTGTVRVRKVVHEDAVPVSAEGYREVVETTRVPVNQIVQAVEAPRDLGDMLVIPVYEERLVRQLVLVEEIHVRRRRETFEHTTATSLRREEVIVERLDLVTQQWVAEGS
jgi:stress response protein YsnF